VGAKARPSVTRLYLQTILLGNDTYHGLRSSDCIFAIFHSPVTWRIYYACLLVSIPISGTLAYSEYIPPKLIIATLATTTLVLLLIGWLLKRRGILR
jgi:hypothetical protein